MPKYMIQASYTAEGLQGLQKDKASGRRASVSKAAEALGGKLEALYYAFGEDDAVAILDLPATAEALETLGVPVWGYGTSELPAFFTDASGISLEHRFESAASIAEALRIHWDLLESPTGSLVVVPPPSPLPREEVEPALAEALREAASRNLPGKEVTPFLLGALSDATAGRTRAANLHLLEKNAHVAAQIATALALASSRD